MKIIKMNTNFAKLIFIAVLSLIFNHINHVSSLLCYSCVSTTPGCTLEHVSWWIYSSITCPEYDDKCVKIIEQDGSDVRVTRDCLSNIMSLRDDVPADRFEGCRPSAPNPKRSIYVDNAIGELDLKQNLFTNTTYCFCEFDEWCNGTIKTCYNLKLIILTLFILIICNLYYSIWF